MSSGSKFRARALDAVRPLTIHYVDDLPDLPDYAVLNRTVPPMPTGMEKEEETEHHLQLAICAQQSFETVPLVIPTPEVYAVEENIDILYPATYKPQRQLIHMQAFAMEAQDVPDYDLDSEDELWLKEHSDTLKLDPLGFENIIDQLEKGSGQQVMTLKEACLIIKEEDQENVTAVYDYWLNKRLRTQLPLLPQVKSEKRDGSNSNNPYVAFRRRTEKMQTRKNRKNDEASYEKMLKLRRELNLAVTLLDMIKKREMAKRELLQATVDIYHARYRVKDFNGIALAQATAALAAKSSTINNNVSSPYSDWFSQSIRPESANSRNKRDYKKRKHKTSSRIHDRTLLSSSQSDTSDDETQSVVTANREGKPSTPENPFQFKRKKGCVYYNAIQGQMGNWPWCASEEGGLGDKRYRYSLTSVRLPNTNRYTCIGYVRRRLGRGGRVIFDRAYTPLDEHWPQMEFGLNDPNSQHVFPNGVQPIPGDFTEFLENAKSWPHFRNVDQPEEAGVRGGGVAGNVQPSPLPEMEQPVPKRTPLVISAPSLQSDCSNTSSEDLEVDEVPEPPVIPPLRRDQNRAQIRPTATSFTHSTLSELLGNMPTSVAIQNTGLGQLASRVMSKPAPGEEKLSTLLSTRLAQRDMPVTTVPVSAPRQQVVVTKAASSARTAFHSCLAAAYHTAAASSQSISELLALPTKPLMQSNSTAPVLVKKSSMMVTNGPLVHGSLMDTGLISAAGPASVACSPGSAITLISPTTRNPSPAPAVLPTPPQSSPLPSAAYLSMVAPNSRVATATEFRLNSLSSQGTKVASIGDNSNEIRRPTTILANTANSDLLTEHSLRMEVT